MESQLTELKLANDNAYEEAVSSVDMEEVKRLGEQQVDLLEVMKHQAKNWSVFELQELYKYYAALILKMNEEKDNQ